MAPDPTPNVPFADALRVWARIALRSFGGPAAQIAVMHREVVERERWVDEESFLAATQLCMLLPGPEAQQLATWLGWRLHGVVGGLVAGCMFVLPGFVSILAISLAYVGLGDVPQLTGAGIGLRAAVVAVVAEAVVRVGRRALGDRRRLAIAVAAFVASFALNVPFPLVVATAALLGVLGLVPTAGGPTHADTPSWRATLTTAGTWAVIWLAPLAVLAGLRGTDDRLVQIGGFFAGAATVSFGGAYAVLAWVAQRAVETHGWLTPHEMLDGLAFAETTPGPLIQVVQFVAFLAAWRDGGLGAALAASVLATWVTYAPSFLWIFTLAPWLQWVRAQQVARGALAAITAAVVGAIANLGAWSAVQVCFGAVREGPRGVDVPVWGTAQPVPIALAILAGVALVRFHAPMLPTLAAGALLGALLA